MPLTPQQLRAATLLSEGISFKTVASEVHVTPKTLYTWRRAPEFIEAVDRLLLSQQAIAMQSLHSLKLVAIEALAQLLTSDSEAIRLRAIAEILNRTLAPMPLSPVVTDEVAKRQRWDQIIQGLQKKSNETFQTGTEVECTLKQ